jgi:hypothetical protein
MIGEHGIWAEEILTAPDSKKGVKSKKGSDISGVVVGEWY